MTLSSQTALKALLMSSEEKLQRVVRRVLSDLDVQVESCVDGEVAVQKLTRCRYEAVIVDFKEYAVADQILRGVQLSPVNKRAVIVALVDPEMAAGSAFAQGAHFVLHKTSSVERTKSSFRAVRTLMKRERRRNTRMPIEFPVECRIPGKAEVECTSSDLGEGGLAVQSRKGLQISGALQVAFFLPQSIDRIEATGEVAWRNAQGLTGIRFTQLSPEARHQLKVWIDAASGEPVEEQDAPVPGELTDLSLHACYLKMSTPFPLHARVALVMRVGFMDIRAEGIVRVVHPETGMGVEFVQETPDESAKVAAFLDALRSGSSRTPHILIEPEQMDMDTRPNADAAKIEADPLLGLFVRRDQLSQEEFLRELEAQRGGVSALDKALAVSPSLR